MTNNVEIEKKFLLKSWPEKKPDKILELSQFYGEKNNSKFRIRSIFEGVNIRYILTIKKLLEISDVIINQETETEITKDEFLDLKKYCTKFLNKRRFVFDRWELDVFLYPLHLFLAEIELYDKTEIINIPPWLEKNIVCEITNFRQFSNENLAVPMEVYG